MNLSDHSTLFLDKSIRCGGFYELCIQVCPSAELSPISLYSSHFWAFPGIYGPFDDAFNSIPVPDDFYELQGILVIEDLCIPFKLFHIREESPVETGFSWFDVSFYTATLEKVLGLGELDWDNSASCPNSLKEFLQTIMKYLFKVFPFRLAYIDFEISGQYYLHDLVKSDLVNWTDTKIYVGSSNYSAIRREYHQFISIIE